MEAGNPLQSHSKHSLIQKWKKTSVINFHLALLCLNDLFYILLQFLDSVVETGQRNLSV